MKWKKLGLLYSPRCFHEKLLSHAANPLPLHLKGDVYRVFYCGRDKENRSSVGFVDIDILNLKTTYIHNRPIFVHGLTNSFYSHGVSIGNCYEANGKKYILFMGWQQQPHQHWRGDIGRLCVNDDRSLELDRKTPFISTDSIDPISLSYPWVLQDKNSFKMWYGSTLDWSSPNGEMVHVINYATSSDGHNWDKKGLSLPYEISVAQAFSRPSVIHNSSGYHMWFSYRSGIPNMTYRIGYAYSQCGVTWNLLLDKTGIDLSSEGWDSEMIEYPYIFEHKDHYYMLYNGNGYGKTGFGLAVLE